MSRKYLPSSNADHVEVRQRRPRQSAQAHALCLPQGLDVRERAAARRRLAEILLPGDVGRVQHALRLDQRRQTGVDCAVLLHLVVFQRRRIERHQRFQRLSVLAELAQLPVRAAKRLFRLRIEVQVFLPILDRRPLGHDLDDPRSGRVQRLHLAADLDVLRALHVPPLRGHVDEVSALCHDPVHLGGLFRRTGAPRQELPGNRRQRHEDGQHDEKGPSGELRRRNKERHSPWLRSISMIPQVGQTPQTLLTGVLPGRGHPRNNPILVARRVPVTITPGSKASSASPVGRIPDPPTP